MRHIVATTFVSEVAPLLDTYKRDNAWYNWNTGYNNAGSTQELVFIAWKCYKGTTKNALGRVVLGDTKIRSDRELVQSFGLASAAGVQEDADRLAMEALMQKRVAWAAGGTVGRATEVIGPGSVLSTKHWSPLLNDSLILAGIHTRQDFHLALNDDEQKLWAALPRVSAVPTELVRTKRPANAPASSGLGQSEFDKRRATFGAAVKSAPTKPVFPLMPQGASPPGTAQEKWASFICQHPRVLWESWGPRVFARELLGLKFFGYTPYFSDIELGFTCTDPGKAGAASFQDYLRGLSALGYEKGNRSAVIGALSEFLFDDVNALKRIA
jgi:hypothetical protein